MLSRISYLSFFHLFFVPFRCSSWFPPLVPLLFLCLAFFLFIPCHLITKKSHQLHALCLITCWPLAFAKPVVSLSILILLHCWQNLYYSPFSILFPLSLPSWSCRITILKFLKEVKEFKYLGTVLSKHGEMEDVRAVKDRSVIGSLARVIKGRNMSMEIQGGLRNSIFLPTLTYGSETWTQYRVQQSWVCAAEMSYLRSMWNNTKG